MLRIGIILGSTRPGRNGEQVAHWVFDRARQRRHGAHYELIDLAQHQLPLLDERIPPSRGHYEQEHTKAWAEVIDSFDGFVIVTPEYNHSIPAALKNALDFLYAEWNNKAVGFVGYGSAGGVRAVEHLRQVAAELQMADVRAQVMLNLITDFKDFHEFTPAAFQNDKLDELLDQVFAWSTAMAALRQSELAELEALVG